MHVLPRVGARALAYLAALLFIVAMLTIFAAHAYAADVAVTPVTDFFISTIMAVLVGLAGWSLVQARKMLGLREDSIALDVVRKVMDDSLRLSEDRLRELAGKVTIPIGNPYVAGVVGSLIVQAPKEIRQLGYSEEYLAEWALNQIGISQAPAAEPAP